MAYGIPNDQHDGYRYNAGREHGEKLLESISGVEDAPRVVEAARALWMPLDLGDPFDSSFVRGLADSVFLRGVMHAGHALELAGSLSRSLENRE